MQRASSSVSSRSLSKLPPSVVRRDRKAAVLKAIYARLYAAYGPQSWWPARSSFEVMVGAVLVQNTSWANVERAIAGLRRERRLTLERLVALAPEELCAHLRPAGCARVKVTRLLNLLSFLNAHGGVRALSRVPTARLRSGLLAVHGIGPETADSILLYAFGRPVFVVDAYARRLLERHRFPEAAAPYEDLRAFFEDRLPPDAALYNEYHALIVALGKRYKTIAVEHGYPLAERRFFL
jgi:endonuclease III related protein